MILSTNNTLVNFNVLKILTAGEYVVIITNDTHKVIFVNDYLLKLTGYAEDEVLNKDICDIFGITSEKNKFTTYLAAIMEADSIDTISVSLKTKSGGHIDVQLSSIIYKDEKNGKLGVFSLGTDISEKLRLQKLAESTDKAYKIKAQQLEEKNKFLEDTTKAMLNVLEDAKGLEEAIENEKDSVEQKVNERTVELREEQARLVSSINGIPSGVILLDNDSNVVLTNSNLGEVLKSKEIKWTIDIIQNFFGRAFDIINTVRKVIDEKVPVLTEEILVSSRFFKVYITPIFIKPTSKTNIGVLILIDDITESKVLQRSKDEFFTIASHELRTPLSAIKGNSQLLLDKFLPALNNKELTAITTDIYDSSMRLINIVNEFLTVSRLEQGKLDLNMAKVDINKTILEVIEELKVTAIEKGLYMKLAETSNVSAEPVFVNTDYFRIKEILVNLISNAIAFTSKGGITISIEIIGKKVKVCVSDTGIGIPERTQSLLFRKFQQANETLLVRNVSKGTGLGLYISKLLIETMGGVIYLGSSKENVGSTFCFEIPKV